MSTLKVVRCHSDNYSYVLADGSGALVVDPGDADPVIEVLEDLGIRRLAVLCTHHHADHVGGVAALIRRYPSAEVVAHAIDHQRIAGVARPVSHGDDRVAAGLSVRVMHTPGHTRGSVSYLIEDLVFTGDTLFGAGCGRIFEGTAAMLYASICALACLPPATRVCFGHEYTADNLRFALELQPEQRAAAERLAKIALPSAPSTIAEEIATNPFLRCADPDLAARVGKPGADPAAVFAALRAMKDGW